MCLTHTNYQNIEIEFPKLTKIKPAMSETQQAETPQSGPYGKLLELSFEIIKATQERKQKLVNIVLEDTDAKTALKKLRRTLLEFQGPLLPDKSEIKEEGDKAMFSVFDQIMKEVSMDQLKFMTEMMNKAIEPAHTHRLLLEKMGEVIRSELTDKEKVDKISDLLI